MTYSFQKQLQKGNVAEERLDKFFGEHYEITPASHAEQRQGVDRWLTDKASGLRFSVEYKADSRASKTGNAFVETISVDTNPVKRGWAYTSTALFLIYYVPPDGLIYALKFTALREKLSTWVSRYPVRKIPNDGYFTHGILVPLREFEQICTDPNKGQVITL